MGGQEMVRERLEDVVTRESDLAILAQSLFSDAAISSEFVRQVKFVNKHIHNLFLYVFVWDSLFCRSM
jgi:hypothetical protein